MIASLPPQQLLIDPDLSRELMVLARRRLMEAPELKGVAAVEARWIVQQAIKQAAHGEQARADMQSMVTRRLAGEPLSRIFGEAEFYGLPFGVNEATLDPRNDTEVLVDLILQHFPAQNSPVRILDLGTGTGCIPVALLSERGSWTALGVDLSPLAVEQALKNAADPRLGGASLIQRLSFQISDWFSELEESQDFDLIVSNPPYLSADDREALDKSVKEFDPLLALDGGKDGLECYRIILEGAPRFLSSSGYVALEIGWTQRTAVCLLAAKCGFKLIAEAKDLQGRDRALLFQIANCPL